MGDENSVGAALHCSASPFGLFWDLVPPLLYLLTLIEYSGFVRGDHWGLYQQPFANKKYKTRTHADKHRMDVCQVA
jgi:hypothetical protein